MDSRKVKYEIDRSLKRAVKMRELHQFANALKEDTEVLKSYKVYLFNENLKKPQYNKMNFSAKEIRTILEIVISDSDN